MSGRSPVIAWLLVCFCYRAASLVSPSETTQTYHDGDTIKLNFGKPGLNEQPGYQQIGKGDYHGWGSSEFKCGSPSGTCSLHVDGFTSFYESQPEVQNQWANISNILRSGFWRNKHGDMIITVGGLRKNQTYQATTYHHISNGNTVGVFSYEAWGGSEDQQTFTLQYAGNREHNLRMNYGGASPDPPLIHTETVTTDANGTIELSLGFERGGPWVVLNGMELTRTSMSMIGITGSQEQEMTELRAAIPRINLYVPILSKVVAYPNVPPQVKEVVDGLKPLAGKDADDPLLLAALTDPNVLMASRMIANDTFQMMIMGVLPAVDSLLKYCMSTDPNKDIDTQFPMIRALQPVGNPSCTGIDATLKQQLESLVDIYIKELKGNVEMQALLKQMPIILTTLKILQPFLDIPSMDAALVSMARELMSLMQMDPTDPMFMLMFATPDADAMIQQLKAMEEPDMMQKLEVMVAGVAFLPSVCSTDEMKDSTKETLKLTQGEDIGAICRRMDMSTVAANIEVLERMNDGFVPSGNDITDIIVRIPLLQKTVKIIEPFMTLPGFDAELKYIITALAPLAEIDSTNPANSATLMAQIADPSVNAQVDKFYAQAGEAKVAAMLGGIGGLTYACNQSQPEYFNHLRTFLQGSTVDTMCAKVPASLAGDLGKLQVYEDALKPTKQPADGDGDSSAGSPYDPCVGVVCQQNASCFVVNDTTDSTACICNAGYFTSSDSCDKMLKVFKSELKLNEPFTEELNNPWSPEFKNLLVKVETSLLQSLQQSIPTIEAVQVTAFRPGSVLVEYNMIITDPAGANVSVAEVQGAAETAIASDTSLGVDKTYVPVVEDVPIVYATSAPVTEATTTTPTPETVAKTAPSPLSVSVSCNSDHFTPYFTYNNTAGNHVHLHFRMGHASHSEEECTANVNILSGEESKLIGAAEFVSSGKSIPYLQQHGDGRVTCDGRFEERVVGGVEKIVFGVDVDVEESISKRNVSRGSRRYLVKLRCALTRLINATSTSGWRIDDTDPYPTTVIEAGGTFAVDMRIRFFTSAAYSSLHNTVFTTTLDDMVFMEVSETTRNPLFHFIVEECWATAGPSMDATDRDVFLRDQCPVDTTTTTTTTQKRTLRMSIKSFYFPTRAESQIFVHCRIMICMQDDSNCVQKTREECAEDLLPSPGVYIPSNKRRNVLEDDVRIVTSEQRILLDTRQTFVPGCGEGFVYDRVRRICTSQNIVQIKGVYLDIPWQPTFSNISSPGFRTMAEEKEFQIFHLLQVTGSDDVITGVKILKATKGSVILDLLLLHVPTTSPQTAFRTFKDVVKKSRTTTSRVMKFLKIRADMEIDYIEYMSPVPSSEFSITTALLIVVPVLVVIIAVLAVLLYRKKKPNGATLPTERGLHNKGVDA